MKVDIQRKSRGYDLILGDGEAKNYSSLFKLAKALIAFAKGQGI